MGQITKEYVTPLEQSQAKYLPTVLLGIIVIAASILHSITISRDLPLFAFVDEELFATIAIKMNEQGSWNPAWFGNPGSTVIYPLAVLFRVWFAMTQGQPFWGAAPAMGAAYTQNIAPFFVMGRTLTAVYSISAIVVLYYFGREIFNERVAIATVLFTTFYFVVVQYAVNLRTDSAGLLFGLLALTACLHFYREQTVKAAILVGVAVGLAVASRYFMVTLVAAYCYIVLCIEQSWTNRLRFLIIIGGTSLIAFFVASPFVLLDFYTFRHNVLAEARSFHPGADGLTPLGNLWWYVSVALPTSLGWPQVLLGIAGLVMFSTQRSPKRRLLAVFVIVFMAAICVSPLHWDRWAIPIMPLLGLCCAGFVDWMIFGRNTLSAPKRQTALFATIIVLLTLQPAYQTIRWATSFQYVNTRVLAREWIMENVPEGSVIALETYTAPIENLNYKTLSSISLADRTFASYAQENTQYWIASSLQYDRYYAEPTVYPDIISFYDDLARDNTLMQEFAPSDTVRGPIIKIYKQ